MQRTLKLTLALALTALGASAQTSVWSETKANTWYGEQPWLIGANYIPATAINQLEMWQSDSFDPARIDKELGWAQHIGMNTMRVFLHDLLFTQDAEGFKRRMDRFLTIAHKHRIRPVFVLFDSCWDPAPQLGKQRAPRPGVHNSGWVQSPGAKALQDSAQYARLEAYVKGVVGAFAADNRILAWDVWNEPDNPNTSSYGNLEPKNKVDLVYGLGPRVRVGEGSWRLAASDVGRLERGLVRGQHALANGPAAASKLRRHLLSQLRFTHRIREACEMAGALSSSLDLHRIYGAREREFLRGHVTGCRDSSRRDD